MINISFEIQKRFWKKIKIPKNNIIEDCWTWDKYLDKDGYGTFYFNGSSKKAHRFSYELYNEIPNNMCVCHNCDNPACVNPYHLFCASHEDNMHDMKNKKRSRVSVGSNNTNTILNENDVKEILDAILNNTLQSTQEVLDYDNRFTKYNLAKIKIKKTWTHVTNEYSDHEFEYIRDVLNNRINRSYINYIKKDINNKKLTLEQLMKKYVISTHVAHLIKNS